MVNFERLSSRFFSECEKKHPNTVPGLICSVNVIEIMFLKKKEKRKTGYAKEKSKQSLSTVFGSCHGQKKKYFSYEWKVFYITYNKKMICITVTINSIDKLLL